MCPVLSFFLLDNISLCGTGWSQSPGLEQSSCLNAMQPGLQTHTTIRPYGHAICHPVCQSAKWEVAGEPGSECRRRGNEETQCPWLTVPQRVFKTQSPESTLGATQEAFAFAVLTSLNQFLPCSFTYTVSLRVKIDPCHWQ